MIGANGYYSYEDIDNTGAQYRMIIGERSNGKTYGALMKIVKNYLENGKQSAYIRRYREDFVGKRGQVMFSAIENDLDLEKLSGGMWNGIEYYSGAWYFKFSGAGMKKIRDEKPFCYGFAINQMEHDKSTSYPNINLVVFDEFLSRTFYLTNEFVLFMNVLSTIIRQRDDVIVYMLGNTVSQYSPYFDEMGIDIRHMEQGTIDIVKYGDSDLKVAVEYPAPTEDVKKSNDYFAFDNPQLSMITHGDWEFDLYPHMIYKYRPKDIKHIFFIEYNDELLQCEVIKTPESRGYFVFVHRKTTELKEEKNKNTVIFSNHILADPRYEKRITHPVTERGKLFAKLFLSEKTFFQDNSVGECVRNYLEWSKTAPIFRN